MHKHRYLEHMFYAFSQVLERMSETGSHVSSMKKNKNIPASIHPQSIARSRAAAQNSHVSRVDATTVTTEVLFAFSETVEALHAIMRHPRSLNRDIANWRPPRSNFQAFSNKEN